MACFLLLSCAVARKQRSASHAQSEDALHGNAPDSCPVALLMVDVINDFAFPGGEQLARSAEPAARKLHELHTRARGARVPCIYANDNFGRWRSDFAAQIRHCLQGEGPGARLASLLAPTADDYFVLKPKHSAFYQTCLELLLQHLGTETLIIGGFSTESCVSFSASDAYLRGYAVIVPGDCVASRSAAAKRDALAQLTRSVRARTPRGADVHFAAGERGLRVRLATR